MKIDERLVNPIGRKTKGTWQKVAVWGLIMFGIDLLALLGVGLYGMAAGIAITFIGLVVIGLDYSVMDKYSPAGRVSFDVHGARFNWEKASMNLVCREKYVFHGDICGKKITSMPLKDFMRELLESSKETSKNLKEAVKANVITEEQMKDILKEEGIFKTKTGKFDMKDVEVTVNICHADWGDLTGVRPMILIGKDFRNPTIDEIKQEKTGSGYLENGTILCLKGINWKQPIEGTVFKDDLLICLLNVNANYENIPLLESIAVFFQKYNQATIRTEEQNALLNMALTNLTERHNEALSQMGKERIDKEKYLESMGYDKAAIREALRPKVQKKGYGVMNFFGRLLSKIVKQKKKILIGVVLFITIAAFLQITGVL